MAKANLLVIEDNEEVRENLLEILELYGYAVSGAKNGLEGVRAAIQDPPDLILCDVMMPELDGYGVLNLVTANESTAGIPFVFLTARTEKADIRRGMNLGADDYITKPFYKDELLRVIELRLKKAADRGKSPAAPAPTTKLINPEAGLKTLHAHFTERGRTLTYDHQQTILREGEHPHFVYRVVTGHVHLVGAHEYGRGYVIAEIGPGETFGLTAALERIPYHYTAQVTSVTAACEVLPVANLLQLINTDGTVAQAIIQQLARRVKEHGERLVLQAYDSVKRRTALVICDLHDKYAGAPLELSREELAQLVGTTKESVIRTLADLKRAGLVTLEGRCVLVNNIGELRRLHA